MNARNIILGAEDSGIVFYVRLHLHNIDCVTSNLDIGQLPDALSLGQLRAKPLSPCPDSGSEFPYADYSSAKSFGLNAAIDKRNQYEWRGVPEYWILDPTLEQVTVLTLTEQGYGVQTPLRLGHLASW
ncbi:MAG: Uma2 family endonuclease [Leptolyngbyaceae cyanobacterium]